MVAFIEIVIVTNINNCNENIITHDGDENNLKSQGQEVRVWAGHGVQAG